MMMSLWTIRAGDVHSGDTLLNGWRRCIFLKAMIIVSKLRRGLNEHPSKGGFLCTIDVSL